jgi:predicted HAD superfamily Cof-like phosphohydrolase
MISFCANSLKEFHKLLTERTKDTPFSKCDQWQQQINSENRGIFLQLSEIILMK